MKEEMWSSPLVMSVVDVGTVGDGERKVHIVHISDTHKRHRGLTKKLPAAADILVHSGDFLERHDTSKEMEESLVDFNDWLGEMRDHFTAIVVVAGNHDLLLKGKSHAEINEMLSNAHYYVEDESIVVMPFGLTLWGSPWSSAPPTHAFGLPIRALRAPK